MASSNRHWPSMFKSKPCNTHHQWQSHDINSSLLSSGCHRGPFSSVAGCEERSPEPKPRWNPKPEQIRILEAIFNSGMVNPPRDEIRKIRAQLQEYGQVGDANVFYWFQNRKSRSKHKQRHLQNPKNNQSQQNPNSLTTTTTTASSITAPSSSSSSSDKSSPKATNKINNFSLGSANVMDLSNSPTASVNQTYNFPSHGEILPEPFFFPVQQQTNCSTGNNGVFATQGFCFSDLSNVVQVPDQTIGSCPGFLLSELMNQGGSKKVEDEKMMMKLHQHHLSYTVTPAPTAHSTIAVAPPTTTLTVPPSVNQIQGVCDQSGSVGPCSSAGKSTVFINDVAFEVAVGPFNVREAFGDDAVLVHSSGQPVLTNEWGATLNPLQHGAFYYLGLFMAGVN